MARWDGRQWVRVRGKEEQSKKKLPSLSTAPCHGLGIRGRRGKDTAASDASRIPRALNRKCKLNHLSIL